MGRIRFAWNNLIDYPASGMTATSSADGFPVGNLRHPFRTRQWKTAVGSGVEHIVFDFGLLSGDFGSGYYSSGGYGSPPAEISPQAVSAVFVLDHNFTETVDCRIQGNDADSWGSPAVDEAVAYDPGVMVKFFTEGTYRYWRLAVDDSVGGNTQIRIGRLFIGTYFQPARTPLIDMPYQITDPSIQGGPSGGGRFPDPKTMRGPRRSELQGTAGVGQNGKWGVAGNGQVCRAVQGPVRFHRSRWLFK